MKEYEEEGTWSRLEVAILALFNKEAFLFDIDDCCLRIKLD